MRLQPPPDRKNRDIAIMKWLQRHHEPDSDHKEAAHKGTSRSQNSYNIHISTTTNTIQR